MNQSPLSIAIIGWFFIALGTFVLLANVFWLAQWQLNAHSIVSAYGRAADDQTANGAALSHSENRDLIWVGVTQLLAIVAGVFLLRGCNWARWLLVAWLGFHIVLSALHPGHELAVHGVLAAVVVYFLFRAPATEYFRGTG